MFGYEITVLRDTFQRLLRRHAVTNLVKLIEKTHPADIALLFRYLNETEQRELFNLMEANEQTAEFLSELDESILLSLLEMEDPARIADLIRVSSSNDQATILGLLPEEKTQAVMDLLKAEEQEEVEEIMAYPEDSAGSLMSTDVFSLPKNTVAKDAIMALQDHEKAEMVFYLYVTDDEKRLVGVISLRDLVTTPPDKTLEEIMVKTVHTVWPDTDQEEVARLVSRYNYLAVPVVDRENHLLGIVTVDDVVDIIREEATEDFFQMAGIGKDRELLLKSPWENAKARLPWLFATWIGGVLVSLIIGVFDNLLEAVIALAAFIPVITGMGGNAGTQSSTLVVRGLATGRVGPGNALEVIWKHTQVGLLLGLFYGVLLGLVAQFRFVNISAYFAVVVGLSIFASMLLASIIGTVTPLVMRRMNIDPAITSGPFVTTATDIIGVTTYLLIAALLLPH